MKQIDKIYEYVLKKSSVDVVIDSFSNNEDVGVDAYEIEEKLGIVRNNASTFLNNLCNENKLIKVKGRPVRFIPRKIVEERFCGEKIKQEYGYEELKKLILEVDSLVKSEDPFKELIGHDKSLRNQIEQAKAAIMYPKNGLHTLIIGPSGVGKTLFANTMYEYALLKKHEDKEKFPFVSFNCSDYYNNPQLLLSQLFGHIKGAFTGAETDRIGLVEKASGGILFLDEVHRLPPDGQEMLFFLIDKGEYYRLGETSVARKSSLLIIAATTEDPHECLLKTFLRRIPVIITLPSLKEKPVEEKAELVQELFIEEAFRINKKITICPEVLKALVLYDCKGNIGQLKSDIKMLCAKSFLRYLQSNEELKIEFSMLPQNAKDIVFNMSSLDKDIQNYLNIFNDNIIIYPNRETGKNIQYANKSIYDRIYDSLNRLKKEGLSDEEIEDHISKEIDEYFKSFINSINPNKFNIRELYKLLDAEIVDFTYQLVTYASETLNVEFDSKIMFILAFHINYLIDRVKKSRPIINHELSTIKKTYGREYKVASIIVNKISDKFGLEIPNDEKGFITILLANNIVEKEDIEKIGVLVITHGDSTASSMANVCNRLLNSDYVRAIDMPLEESVEVTYVKALTMVKAIDKGKGVIILIDMGSLKNFGDKITEETGIMTRTIENVSTPLVLEVLRRVIYKDENIDDIYISFVNSPEQNQNKMKAIITVCATGKGTSLMLEKMIGSLLKDFGENINIFPFNYSEVQNSTESYTKVKNEYDIIACIGNIQPDIDVPFFSLEELFDEKSKQRFFKYIEGRKVEDKNNESDVYEVAKGILEDFCLFINPKKAVEYIKRVIESLIEVEKFDYYFNNEASTLNLITHIGIMIERIIMGNKVCFEKVEEYKKRCSEEFMVIREALKFIEDIYSIEVSDDEICYILKIVYSRRNE